MVTYSSSVLVLHSYGGLPSGCLEACHFRGAPLLPLPTSILLRTPLGPAGAADNRSLFPREQPALPGSFYYKARAQPLLSTFLFKTFPVPRDPCEHARVVQSGTLSVRTAFEHEWTRIFRHASLSMLSWMASAGTGRGNCCLSP